MPEINSITAAKLEELYDDAVRMLAEGHDNVYIEMQFAEQKIDNETINAVLTKVKNLRKAHKRSVGLKLIIGGLATVAVGFILSFISFNSQSPAYFILYGLITVGFMTFAKGVIDMIF